MAIRTWGRVLLAALGVALLAGAGQLGVAFGLGIVRLTRTFPVDQENQWTAQMAWVTWFAMVAAVAGAIAADRMARRHGYDGGTGSRVAYAVFAGLGAAAVAPLCMQPARFAEVPSTDPVVVIGLSAGLGAVAGVFVALGALSQESQLWNVVAVTTGGWLLALISVAPSLGPGDPLADVRLGVFDPASLGTGTAQSSAVVTMPLLALIVGAATAGLGRWLGRPPRAIAASGLVGPAMLALAYLVAGPGTSADKYQAAPYWGALLAVGAGTLGSVLATVARRPVWPEKPTEPAPVEPASAVAEPRKPSVPAQPAAADEPTADLAAGDNAADNALDKAADKQDDDQAAAAPAPPITPEFRSTSPAPARSTSPGPAHSAPSAPAPAPTRSSRRPQVVRDSGAAEVATAFAAGRRAAGRKSPPDERDAATTADRDADTDAPAARPRRGLFGRRRSKPGPAPVEAVAKEPAEPDAPAQRGGQGRPEQALKPRDEEYVDWVSGLAPAATGTPALRPVRWPPPEGLLRFVGHRM